MEDYSKSKEQVLKELNEARLLIRRLQESLVRQKQAVIKLQENEKKYLCYFSIGDDVLFSYDNLLNILSVSPNVERVIGYRSDELAGKNLMDLLFLIHPEDKDKVLKNVADIFSGKAVHCRIYRYITRDGRVKYGETNGVPIIRDGCVTAMASMARDITERIERERTLHESEERYRITLDSIPDAVGIIRVADNRYLYANEVYGKITGYSMDEIIGNTAHAVKVHACMEEYDHCLDTIKGNTIIDSMEQKCCRKDGTVFDSLVSARPIHYGGEDCMILVITDITSIKKAEEEKKLLEFQSLKMESMATLARGIGHDFNNILTTIIGYTKMSMKNIMELSTEEHDLTVIHNELKEVRKSALRARNLVEQLLSFSRYTEKTYEPIELSAAVRESLKLLHPVLPFNIHITEDLQESGMIKSDPARIHLIMMNLCTNAANAMNDMKGELEIRVTKETVLDDTKAHEFNLLPGNYLKLTVKDNGCGMTPRVKTRVFDPYFTTKWKGDGTGMGLSIVHGIVKSHDGTIVCTSSPREGTTFEIYLPEFRHSQEKQEPCTGDSFKAQKDRFLCNEKIQRTRLKAAP